MKKAIFSFFSMLKGPYPPENARKHQDVQKKTCGRVDQHVRTRRVKRADTYSSVNH